MNFKVSIQELKLSKFFIFFMSSIHTFIHLVIFYFIFNFCCCFK